MSGCADHGRHGQWQQVQGAGDSLLSFLKQPFSLVAALYANDMDFIASWSAGMTSAPSWQALQGL